MQATSAKTKNASGRPDTYRSLVTALIRGAVICPWSFPTEARLLEREDIQEKINAWVDDLGMELAETSSGNGHYLVYRGFDPTVKAVARDIFTSVMKDLRFYVRMLEVLMNTLHADMTMVAGEELRFHDFLNQVIQSPSLQAQLSELSLSLIHI